MEELNILEVRTGERKMQLHIVVKLFCLLLLMILLSDPTFTRSAEHFFDLLLVPVSESGNTIYIKNNGKMLDVAKTAKSASKEINFSNPAPSIDKTSLLTEVAITSQSLILEDNFHPNSIEDVQDIPMLEVVDEGRISATIPQTPLPESAASEINVSDSILQNSIISEVPSIDSKLPSDKEIYTDTKHPADIEIQIEENISSDIQNDSSTTPTPIPEMTETDSTVSDVTTPSDIEDLETGSGESIIEAPSCFLLDESGMLYGFLPEYAEIPDGCLMLPEECTGIRSGAFSGIGFGISELYLPANATMIENGAFIGLDSLEWIDVEGTNPMYTSINGVLFDTTTTQLLSFPAGRTDAYSLPEYVTQIAAGAFTNTSLSRLDFRRCSSLFLEGNIFGSSTGDGIVIAVPAESLPVYEEIFNTYAVILTI